jgi:hypothetical protein
MIAMGATDMGLQIQAVRMSLFVVSEQHGSV